MNEPIDAPLLDAHRAFCSATRAADAALAALYEASLHDTDAVRAIVRYRVALADADAALAALRARVAMDFGGRSEPAVSQELALNS